MTHRVLPVAEWSRLAGTPLGAIVAELPTTGLSILVVEDADGAIVGHWTESFVPLLEQVWVHPDHQKRGVVVRHLLSRMRTELRKVRASAFLTFARTEEVARLLIGLKATRLPGDAYAVPVERT